MKTRTKNRIGAAGFALILLSAGAYLAVQHWPARWTFTKPHGITAARALATDMSDFDDQKLMAMVKDLDLKNSTTQQQVELVEKMREAFNKMPPAKRFAMLLSMMKTITDDVNSVMMTNTKVLMQAYMTQQMRQYMAASPEEKKKLLDERIDEQEAMQSMQKMQGFAASMFGGAATQASSPLQANGMPDMDKLRGLMGTMINDAVINTPPADRAATSQYYMDMRARRAERGLPVMF